MSSSIGGADRLQLKPYVWPPSLGPTKSDQVSPSISLPTFLCKLVAREAGNFVLPAYPGLIIKDSYWRWPERNLAGNAIDFHVQILGRSFHDAMRHITGT